jgi:hypothetical protein
LKLKRLRVDARPVATKRRDCCQPSGSAVPSSAYDDGVLMAVLDVDALQFEHAREEVFMLEVAIGSVVFVR